MEWYFKAAYTAGYEVVNRLPPRWKLKAAYTAVHTQLLRLSFADVLKATYTAVHGGGVDSDDVENIQSRLHGGSPDL